MGNGCSAEQSAHTHHLSKFTNLYGSHAKQETQVRSLGREDPLEKGMATHSSILPIGYSAWDRSQTRLSD